MKNYETEVINVLNLLSIGINSILTAVNGYVLRKVTKEKKESAKFIKCQILWYLASNVVCIIAQIGQVVGFYGTDLYENHMLVALSDFGSSLWFILALTGIWQYSFQHWVISREIPKFLHPDEPEQFYLIPLSALGDRGYKILEYTLTVTFYLIFTLFILLGTLFKIYVIQSQNKLPTLQRLWTVSLWLQTIPVLLPFLFLGKGVFTIWRSVKGQLNSKVMGIHLVSLFTIVVFISYYCVIGTMVTNQNLLVIDCDHMTKVQCKPEWNQLKK